MNDGWRPRYAHLLDQLQDKGALGRRWRSAFDAVPRHPFIPDQVWRVAGKDCLPLTRTQDTEAWWDLVHGDEPVVTQVQGSDPTSSSSMPSMVATMLAALDPQPGQRTLEVGTGTGWNAALLAHRVGADHLTTVEFDPVVAGQAQQALFAAGHPLKVTVADGEDGWPPGAPYERILATCSVRTIPRAWLRQASPGAVLVAPLHAGAVVKLTMLPDGTATGRFVTGSSFMLSRPQLSHLTDVAPGTQGWKSPTALEPTALAQLGFVLYVHALRPEWYLSTHRSPGACHATVLDGQGSAAQTDGGGSVWEYGPRTLWEELENLWEDYQRHGSPPHPHFGLTVTPTEERVWLHDAATVLGRPVTTA